VAEKVAEPHHPILYQIIFLTAVVLVVNGTLLSPTLITPGHTTHLELYIWSVHTFSRGSDLNSLHTWLHGWSPSAVSTEVIGKICFHFQPLKNP